jgi:hypothetical protein
MNVTRVSPDQVSWNTRVIPTGEEADVVDIRTDRDWRGSRVGNQGTRREVTFVDTRVT